MKHVARFAALNAFASPRAVSAPPRVAAPPARSEDIRRARKTRVAGWSGFLFLRLRPQTSDR